MSGENKIPRWKLYLLMAGLIVIGACGASFSKLQGQQKIDGKKWQHPWFQAFAMFIGESLWLIYYSIQVYLDKKKYGTRGINPDIIEARKEGLKTHINPFLLAIPASWDCVASAMIYAAYLNMPISVAEMMGGGLVVITAISSILFLNKKLYRHHWTSLVFIVGGVSMVGASSIKNDDYDGDSTLGVILMLWAMCVQAMQMITEEKLLRNYKLSPLKVIGLEGIFGMSIYIVFLFIAYFIKCTGSFCHDGRLEDSLKAIGDLPKNPVLFILVIALIIDIGVYNSLGVSVTKYASWGNRATVNTSKVVLIWLFFLIYPGEGGETFEWLQFFGFILIIIGTVIYNEIVEIPIFGFNQYTLRAIETREISKESHDTLINVYHSGSSDINLQFINSPFSSIHKPKTIVSI